MMTNINTKSTNLIISAVGDISFEGLYSEEPNSKIFDNVKQYFVNSDICIANLENPLTLNKKYKVTGKCTLHGHPNWANILKGAGFNIVSLANNHIMDYGKEGLRDTLQTLKNNGIKYVGAGENINEANKPLIINVKDCTVSILARSSVVVSSPSYANESNPGTAFLDIDELNTNITQCKRISDIVIVLIHWGLEEYQYPSPNQISIAKNIVNNGANVIIGHHPHVIQGMQAFDKNKVFYSLGNFYFNQFLWEPNSKSSEMHMFTLSNSNKQGLIANIRYNQTKNIFNSENIFTSINSNSEIIVDSDPTRFIEYKKLSRKLERRDYGIWWKLYSLSLEWKLRFSKQINIRNLAKNIAKLKLRHLTELIHNLKKSLQITTGKSTNPYE